MQVNKAKPRIHVVAAIILNSRDEVLIAKRPVHLDQGGLWEFPGGKRESGESSAQALVRELHEELDLIAELALPVTQITHEYSEKIVTLEFFEVSKWHGDPLGKEGQLISWVAKSQLEKYRFPAANKVVLRALNFSRIILVTPIEEDQVKFIDGLERCLAGGRLTVQLTRTNQSIAQYRSLSQRIYDLCEKYRARLILDAAPEILSDLPNAGMHLNTSRLMACTERPVKSERMLTATCHHLEQVKQAESLDVDAVLLTPIKSQPGPCASKALGWGEVEKICAVATVPVFAHGGLRAADFPKAIASGCYGMGVGSGFWALQEVLNVEKFVAHACIPLPSMNNDI